MPLQEAPSNGGWSNLLSPREREVALLVNRGLSNKEIAHELRVSNGTVKLHVHHIFLKIGAHRRKMLMSFMKESGIHGINANDAPENDDE
jgi:DNA-binding NarL/FixJ family response regulator